VDTAKQFSLFVVLTRSCLPQILTESGAVDSARRSPTLASLDLSLYSGVSSAPWLPSRPFFASLSPRQPALAPWLLARATSLPSDLPLPLSVQLQVAVSRVRLAIGAASPLARWRHRTPLATHPTTT
jgi:hypothetical protein